MATQSLTFGYTTGQTLTAQLFLDDGSDTVVATADSVTEATNRKGRYVAAFTDVAAGDYLLVYLLGGSGAGSEKYTLTLTTATFEPWSESNIPAIKAKTDQLAFTVANQVDANALSGGGDATAVNQAAILEAVQAIDVSTEVTVVPLTGVVEGRVNGTTIKVFTGETLTVAIAVVDAAGASVDVSALSLSIVIEGRLLTDVVTIANGSITKTGSTVSFAVPSELSSAEGDYQWSLRKATDNSVLLQGPFIVRYAAQVDA